jgi:quercetin dioxygenase-like cupin family protein
MPVPSMIIRDINDLPLRMPPTAPGIHVKTLLDESNSKSMRAGIMSWGPGTKSPTQPHYHNVEELQVVLGGHATLWDCNNEPHPLKPGTVFLTPPGIEGTHGIENTSLFPMTLLFVYPTQDFTTDKYDITSGRKLKSSIFIKELEDFKLEPQKSPDIMMKMICNSSNAERFTAGIMWCNPVGKSSVSKPHYHSIEEFQIVLHGNSTLIDCNGGKQPLSEGFMFQCPSGIEGAHALVNTGDFPMSLLFAYPSQDFKTTQL